MNVLNVLERRIEQRHHPRLLLAQRPQLGLGLLAVGLRLGRLAQGLEHLTQPAVRRGTVFLFAVGHESRLGITRAGQRFVAATELKLAPRDVGLQHGQRVVAAVA